MRTFSVINPNPMRFLLLFLLFATTTDPFAQLRLDWARDLHQKQVEASVALYAPDAVFIQPDGTRVAGTAAIRALFEQVTAALDSSLTFSSQRVERSGDLAYDSGTYTETLVTRATLATAHMRGSYLTVYRKQGDSWKIVEQAWTGGPDPGAAR